MKNKKISELKKMSNEERSKKISELKIELIKSKTNKSSAKEIKKTIAKMLTLNK
ncbi:MAG: 50S ribosomal protein L29 [Minisyncoccales bacterium]